MLSRRRTRSSSPKRPALPVQRDRNRSLSVSSLPSMSNNESSRQSRFRTPSVSSLPATLSNTEPVSGDWTEEEAKNWLELSGKKWMRYYHRTQGPNKFKIRKDKSKGKKAKPLGTGSSDCAPMVHPEEIKITIFEYPDPEDGEYKRGPVRHVQSINPFLTATNMLDALKLAIGGDPKIAAHNAELKSAENEVKRLTKKSQSLTKDIEAIENKISQLQSHVSITIPPESNTSFFAKNKHAIPLGGGAKKQKTQEELEKEKQDKLKTLNENLEKKREELNATNLALKDAEEHLKELQSKDVKGSKAKPTETSATITPSDPDTSKPTEENSNKGPPLLPVPTGSSAIPVLAGTAPPLKRDTKRTFDAYLQPTGTLQHTQPDTLKHTQPDRHERTQHDILHQALSI